MAALVWYGTNSTADVHVQMDETSPGADATRSPGTGWVVSTGATLHSAMFAGVERAATTFADTVPPDGTPDDVNGDCLRSTNTYTGDFASANWTIQTGWIAVTNGGSQDGRMRCRLLRGTDPGGAGATEITAGQQNGGLVTDLTTTTQQTSTATFNPGAFSVSAEFIFIQIAWERTGAGGMTNSDVDMRVGTTATVVTSADFTATGFDPAPSSGAYQPDSPDLQAARI